MTPPELAPEFDHRWRDRNRVRPQALRHKGLRQNGLRQNGYRLCRCMSPSLCPSTRVPMCSSHCLPARQSANMSLCSVFIHPSVSACNSPVASASRSVAAQPSPHLSLPPCLRPSVRSSIRPKIQAQHAKRSASGRNGNDIWRSDNPNQTARGGLTAEDPTSSKY